MMSINSAKFNPIPTNSSNVSKSSKERENIELDKLNARLGHISKRVLPSAPYMLTVPSDQPYTLTSYQANDWRRNTPFDVNEEQLQYMSFLSRDFDDGLIRAIGGWDNDKGEIIDNTSSRLEDSRSGTTTPRPGQTTGKKISLAEYKNKKATTQSGSKDTSATNGIEINQERDLNTMKPGRVGIPKPLPPKPLPPKPNASSQSHGQKRSADAMLETKPSQVKATPHVSTPLTKKARTSPPPTASSKPNTASAGPSRRALPSLLSPSLPAMVEEELSRIVDSTTSEVEKSKHQKTTSTNSSGSNKKLDPKSSRSSQELKAATRKDSDENKSHIRNKSSTSSDSVKRVDDGSQPSVRDHGEKKLRPNDTTPSKASPSRQVESSSKPRSSVDKSTAATEAESVKKSKLVKIKIPRARRKDFARLIQMKPHPTKTDPSKVYRQEQKATPERDIDRKQPSRAEKDRASDRPERQEAMGNHKTATVRRNEIHIKAEVMSRQTSLNSVKAGDKRPRKDDEPSTSAPQSKRQKPPNGLDLAKKPSTPNPPPFKSPVLSHHSSATKLRPSTPSNDSRPPSSSRRIDAAEGEVKTPQGSARDVTPLAPSSVEKVNRAERSASNTSSLTSTHSSTSETDKLWRTEQNKFYNLGRTLKHEADALFRTFETSRDPATEKKCMATAVETVLCFMLAYTINDEQGRSTRRLADVKAWETILAWLYVVKRRTSSQILLNGLCDQLEAVVRTIIRSSDLERLDSLPLPSNIPAEVKLPTPDTNGDSTAREAPSKSAQQQQDKYEEYLKFKAKAIDNHRLTQQLWISGTLKLPIEDLQTEFPQSWAKKARAPLAFAKEKLSVTALNGDFYLPMSGVTTGIEAVRAGWSLLGEWCRKEKVDWKGQLGL